MNDNQKIIQNLESISDDCITMYNLYIHNEISKGLEDINNGNTYTCEEIKEIVINW